MRKQNPDPKHEYPIGGRRNHSRFAHLYDDVCRLRAKRLTWQEIADQLSAPEREKLNRTALWKMWDNRQRGAVRVEHVAARAMSEPLTEVSLNPPGTPSQAAAAINASEDEMLGLKAARTPQVVLKVRPVKARPPA